MLSGEATNTNFIVFGLTRPGLEPTIYRTRGEHTNHYATDAVGDGEKTVLLFYTGIIPLDNLELITWSSFSCKTNKYRITVYITTFTFGKGSRNTLKLNWTSFYVKIPICLKICDQFRCYMFMFNPMIIQIQFSFNKISSFCEFIFIF